MDSVFCKNCFQMYDELFEFHWHMLSVFATDNCVRLANVYSPFYCYLKNTSEIWVWFVFCWKTFSLWHFSCTKFAWITAQFSLVTHSSSLSWSSCKKRIYILWQSWKIFQDVNVSFLFGYFFSEHVDNFGRTTKDPRSIIFNFGPKKIIISWKKIYFKNLIWFISFKEIAFQDGYLLGIKIT